MKHSEKPIEDILLEAEIITAPQLAEVKKEHEIVGGSIEDVLLRYLPSSDIELAKISRELGIPCLSLEEIPKDEAAASKIRPNFAYKNKIVPVKLEEDFLIVAMANPLDLGIIDDIRLVSGCEVRAILAKEDHIEEAITRFYGKSAEQIIKEDLGKTTGLITSEGVQAIYDYGLDAESLARDPTVIDTVHQLIIDAVREGVSDIHIEPFEKELKIRYRIDGVLEEQPVPPKHLQPAIISRVKIMAKMNIAERRRPQDGRIQLRIASLGNREIDLRVSTVPVLWGESVVMRILDKSKVSYGLAQLGLLEDNLKQFYQIIKKPHGIILATGPTGSGKTTTLYACLKEINDPGIKIMTIEEPVEYDLEGINQIEVKPEIGVTFDRGLRHILRQDPDKIMVGEIRDPETASMAVHSALTGHLVFSSLHTNDAASAITRLIDMGIEPYLVASTLEGIVAQRLIRKVCRWCAEKYHPDAELLKSMSVDIDNVDEATEKLMIYKAVGCKECRWKGYSGQTGIFEVVVMNDYLRELALQRRSSSSIKRAARKFGMRTLREDGWRKTVMGMATIEEVMRHTMEEDFTLEEEESV